MNSYKVQYIIGTIILCFVSTNLLAQGYEKETDGKEVFKTENVDNVSSSAQNMVMKIAEHSVTHDLAIGGQEYEDPAFNFSSQLQIRAAGDINQDGKADLFYNVWTGDETTEELADRVSKIVLYHGTDNGLDDQNKKLIRGAFSFVPDMDGDDYPEAVEINDEGNLSFFIDDSEGSWESATETTLAEGFGSHRIKSLGDVNDDSYNDLIAYTPGTGTGTFVYLVKGAESVDDFDILALDYANFETGINPNSQFLHSDINGDGTVEFVKVSSYEEGGTAMGTVSILEQSEDSFEMISHDTLGSSVIENAMAMNAGNISSTDINGDGNEELILSVQGMLRVFRLDTDATELLYDLDSAVGTYSSGNYGIINDYNDDGNKEILNLGDTPQLITSDATLNLSAHNLPVPSEASIGLPDNPTENLNSAGDINGDDIADIVIEFDNPDAGEYGYTAFHGNADGNFNDTSEVTFSIEENTKPEIFHSTNLGDINGDGTEDLALTYSTQIGLYMGGSSLDEPDYIIDEIDGNTEFFNNPTGMDINGDGENDLIINMASEETPGLRIFYGGSGFDTEADHTILFGDLTDEELTNTYVDFGMETTANIGDINGDGVDDMLVSNRWAATESFIFLGGDDLAETPDYTIGMGSANVVKLGDFNDNGLNNFAISNNDDMVWVLEGYNAAEGETFSEEPVIRIPAPNQDEVDMQSWANNMTSGDFNGNGQKELVLSPLFHTKKSNGSGAEAIYFFEGGADADSLPDHSLALNGEDLNFSSEFFGAGAPDSLGISAIGLQGIDDMTNDGTDELLISTYNQWISAFDQTNAVLYYGNESLTEIDGEYDIVFEAPNQRIGLGVNKNNTVSTNTNTAVGDFNQNGRTDFVFTQNSDFNFKKDFAYIYEPSTAVSNEQERDDMVSSFSLEQNYPNPFNPTTNINYSLPASGKVTLKVYDITGRLVSTLVDEQQVSGNHTINFDASSLASGVYIYRLKANGFSQTRKMMLIK